MTSAERAAGFEVRRSHGGAHEFHQRALDLADGPEIWIHTVERPTIVVGSSQSIEIVDRVAAEAAGWDVSGRRSGGGIVIVEPTHSCWIDVVISRSDPRWDDDVNRAFGWVGAWWRAALERLGVTDLSMHADGIVARDHGRAVCFAGLGPGEIVHDDGVVRRKVVGLSQRRTRDAARFQGLFLRRWNPDPIHRFVDRDVIPAGLDLDAVAAGLPTAAAGSSPGPSPDQVVEAFLAVAS